MEVLRMTNEKVFKSPIIMIWGIPILISLLLIPPIDGELLFYMTFLISIWGWKIVKDKTKLGIKFNPQNIELINIFYLRKHIDYNEITSYDYKEQNAQWFNSSFSYIELKTSDKAIVFSCGKKLNLKIVSYIEDNISEVNKEIKSVR